MKFGDTPLDEAAGAILAHSLRFGNGSFRKGRVLTADDISTLRAAGLETVVAIRLDADELNRWFMDQTGSITMTPVLTS